MARSWVSFFLLLLVASFVTSSAVYARSPDLSDVKPNKLGFNRRQGTTAATPPTSLVPDSPADAQCTHGPRNRACWYNGFSIATDFDEKHPDTGKTKSYHLEITNTTCNPDGHTETQCLLVNGQYPGPTIYADWGDTLSVTVKNSMHDNGTAMHWHGVRQLDSTGMDGVPGITSCPIAPGDSFTYTFKITQFGTSWYHSHFSAQLGAGVFGTIIMNGPSSENYDEDLGALMSNDWWYQGIYPVNSETLQALQAGGPGPNADALLVNGTSKSASGGKYAQVTIESGKVYKLRLVNPSSDNFIKVKLDNHPFTVISADFIPTIPQPNQDWLQLAPGQRHDVIFTANATGGNYWFRAEAANDCLSFNNGHGRALFTYNGQEVVEPTDSNEAPVQNGCAELDTTPFWNQAVDESSFQSQAQELVTDLTMGQLTTNGQNLILWALNYTALDIDWSKPTLQYVMDGNDSFPKSYDVINIPQQGVWTYWIVQNLQQTLGPTAIQAPPPPHPIHLHGHDFFVLGRGSGQFNAATANLNFARPPRRDTAALPSVGWLAIAFYSNNPGTWLMHCHIAMHIGEGLGVQFLEAPQDIVMPDKGQFQSTCDNWNKYQATMPWAKSDSGV